MDHEAYILRLKEAIKNKYGCESLHLNTFPVKKSESGKVVWEGVIEHFSLQDYLKARRCYVWLQNSDVEGSSPFFIMPESVVIDSASKALEAALDRPKITA